VPLEPLATPAPAGRPAGERGRVQGTGRPRRLRPNGCGCTPPVRWMPGLVIWSCA